MGHNGSVQVDPAKARCPKSPSKHRYTSVDDAWTKARERSTARLEVVPYACDGCGNYHLADARNVGEDVIAKAPIGVATEATIKALAVPEFVPPVRVKIPTPRGNPVFAEQGRVKRELLMEYLKDRDTVTSTEVGEVIDVKASSTIGKYMKNAGWVSSGKGRTAYWLKPGGDVNPIVPIKPEPVREHPAVESKRVWRSVDVTSLPPNATIEDLFGIYKAAGLSLRLQVTDHTDGSGGA